ncbi:hypothetical protein AVEN_150025-1, partial [Araneus ventricosus]
MGMIWKPKDCRGSVSQEDTWQTENFSSDCIGACMKRDPLSPACMIQGVAGVCGRHKLLRTLCKEWKIVRILAR